METQDIMVGLFLILLTVNFTIRGLTENASELFLAIIVKRQL